MYIYIAFLLLSFFWYLFWVGGRACFCPPHRNSFRFAEGEIMFHRGRSDPFADWSVPVCILLVTVPKIPRSKGLALSHPTPACRPATENDLHLRCFAIRRPSPASVGRSGSQSASCLSLSLAPHPAICCPLVICLEQGGVPRAVLG